MTGYFWMIKLSRCTGILGWDLGASGSPLMYVPARIKISLGDKCVGIERSMGIV